MKREKIIKYLQAKSKNTNQAWGEYKLIRNEICWKFKILLILIGINN